MINRLKSELLNVGLKFISIDEKIIRLFLETAPSNVNDIVILPTTKMVMSKVVRKLHNKQKKGQVYNGYINGVRVSVIRCYMGCPNMAIIMEALQRTEAKKVVRIDFCGGITGLQNDVKGGDIIIPKRCYCGDGTTPQYIIHYEALSNKLDTVDNPLEDFLKLITGSQKIYISKPNKTLSKLLYAQGKDLYSSQVKQVDLWTTDALFCEGPEFQKAMKLINIEAVDMESSALFLLGDLYNLQTTSILSISDLPGTEYDLFHSNKVHPEMENGIKRAIKILEVSLPKL